MYDSPEPAFAKGGRVGGWVGRLYSFRMGTQVQTRNNPSGQP